MGVLLITSCARLRSFNCFTLIIATVPPGRRGNACDPRRTTSFYAVRSGPSITHRGCRRRESRMAAHQDTVVITACVAHGARAFANTRVPRRNRSPALACVHQLGGED